MNGGIGTHPRQRKIDSVAGRVCRSNAPGGRTASPRGKWSVCRRSSNSSCVRAMMRSKKRRGRFRAASALHAHAAYARQPILSRAARAGIFSPCGCSSRIVTASTSSTARDLSGRVHLLAVRRSVPPSLFARRRTKHMCKTYRIPRRGSVGYLTQCVDEGYVGSRQLQD